MTHEMEIHCAQCGAEVAPDDRFCGECGAPIEARKTETRVPERSAEPTEKPSRAEENRLKPGSTKRILLVLGILLSPVILLLIFLGLKELGNPGYVSAIAISPDGRLLATGGQRGKVMIWRLSDMKLITEFSHGSYRLHINTLQFDQQGSKLAVDGYRNMAIYDLIIFHGLTGGDAKKVLEVVDDQDTDTAYVGLCLDGATLYGLQRNGEMKVWNQEKDWSGMPTENNLSSEIAASDFKFIGHTAFSPDCRRLAVSYTGEYLGLYHVDEARAPGQKLLQAEGKLTDGVTDAMTSYYLEDLVLLGNGGDTLAAINRANVLLFWDYNKREMIKKAQLTLLPSDPHFALDKEKKNAIISWGYRYGVFKAIDVESGSVVASYTHGPLWYRFLMALQFWE